MPERDYLDYEDWLRDTGGQGPGPSDPDLYNNPAPYSPPARVRPPMPGNAPPGTQWEWNDEFGTWVGPNPIPGYQAPAAQQQQYEPINYGGGGGGFQMPQFGQRMPLAGLNYPSLNLPRLQAPAPFAYESFAAPSQSEAEAEPGFDYALKQGVKAYENSKAYTGTYRGGATIKGINDYARNMANQNYGQVFERKAQTYDRNRNNAADNYMTNYGVTRDVFDRDYSATKDEFAPKARAAELTYARDWDQFAYEGDDAYRRWKALIDANST